MVIHSRLVERYILLLLSVLLIVGLIGCDASNLDNARKTTTISDHNFMKGLEEIKNKYNTVLICISYWNDWQAIVRDLSTGEYKAFIWDGDTFEELESSSLLRMSLVYDNLIPLDDIYQTASLDYAQVLDSNKNWRMINKTFWELPVPSLMAIKMEGLVRPIWVLPYRMYPNEGFVGVFADDGTILRSVKLDRGGLRERHWIE